MQDGIQGTIVLEEHEHEKDLGVHVDNKLCFKEHVAKSTAKANRVVGIIRRTFDFLSNDLFVQLYKSLVRPILEYGHSVWQPHHKTLCSEVEDVQRRATKLLVSPRDKPYPERLAILGLPTLEHRRNRGDMIDLYKYIHEIYDSDRPKFEIISDRATRGNSLRINKQHCVKVVLDSRNPPSPASAVVLGTRSLPCACEFPESVTGVSPTYMKITALHALSAEELGLSVVAGILGCLWQGPSCSEPMRAVHGR
ncbi:uncharacterized protein LOC143294576 [Babylonia areolata]|uniref:uncharacterized protein LOC143294576 n=1 Tax=Babylonia areolata TaxID=304850 RepID=UPI003FD506EB